MLRRDGYVDHDGEPFCQSCYSKLFKPKGFGLGGTTFSTDYVSGQSTPPLKSRSNSLNGGASPTYIPPSAPSPPRPTPSTTAHPAPVPIVDESAVRISVDNDNSATTLEVVRNGLRKASLGERFPTVSKDVY